MNFQDADILLTICYLCKTEDVKSAVVHLDSEDYPTWSEVTNYLNELPNYSQICLFWETRNKKFSIEELEDLTQQFLDTQVVVLEKIINKVEIGS